MVRMPEGMREDIARSAEVTGRSMNAEIVARIEAYDALHFRLGELAEEKEKLAAQLAATKDALTEQRKITDQLRHLIHMQSEDAQRDEETENVIQKKFDELKAQTDYLEILKAELMELSRERQAIDHDESLTIHLPEDLAEAIRKAAETMRRTMEDQAINTLENSYILPRRLK